MTTLYYYCFQKCWHNEYISMDMDLHLAFNNADIYYVSYVKKMVDFMEYKTIIALR